MLCNALPALLVGTTVAFDYLAHADAADAPTHVRTHPLTTHYDMRYEGTLV